MVTEAELVAFQPCGACDFRGLSPLSGGSDDHWNAGRHLALCLVDVIPASEDWKLAELEVLLRSGPDRGAVEDWLDREVGCVMRQLREERRSDFVEGVMDAGVDYNVTARGPFPDGDCRVVVGPDGVRVVAVGNSADDR